MEPHSHSGLHRKSPMRNFENAPSVKPPVKDGAVRALVVKVSPEIDSGFFPIKRIVGERVNVDAIIISDGHDELSSFLLYRHEKERKWTEVPLTPTGNDHWEGFFEIAQRGKYFYSVVSFVDVFKTWRHGLGKKIAAKQKVSLELLEGAEIITAAADQAKKEDKKRLLFWAETLKSLSSGEIPSQRESLALDEELSSLMLKYADRSLQTVYGKQLTVLVEPALSRFSSWYEMFPRSCSAVPGAHGTFKDCEKRLSYIASMGFDILYFPPIHPIGKIHRKGRNNSLQASADQPGSPWAIGSDEGGHKDIHPQLGSLKDFQSLLRKAQELGMEIALDLAFQCAPDHPYVKEHPEWFKQRPDGSIQHAENPPKKYQDIYPFYFETSEWPALWNELKSVVEYWIAQGVRVFRVDNPHTKPFRFWQWLLSEVKAAHPDTLFLSEAFTRPNMMYHLAKIGYQQSYTYFTWRTTKKEITQYMTELTQTEVREFFGPNFWPNTPDILPGHLKGAESDLFKIRLLLAATLSSNYGIYGPAYELCENKKRDDQSEEYLNSEKFEIKHWDIESPTNLRKFITQINRIRKENKALQDNWNFTFHGTDNENVICFSKRTDDLSNVILVLVNLEMKFKHAGWTELSLKDLGLNDGEEFTVQDLLDGTQYQWEGARNYFELDPEKSAAHIFKVIRPKQKGTTDDVAIWGDPAFEQGS